MGDLSKCSFLIMVNDWRNFRRMLQPTTFSQLFTRIRVFFLFFAVEWVDWMKRKKIFANFSEGSDVQSQISCPFAEFGKHSAFFCDSFAPDSDVEFGGMAFKWGTYFGEFANKRGEFQTLATNRRQLIARRFVWRQLHDGHAILAVHSSASEFEFVECVDYDWKWHSIGVRRIQIRFGRENSRRV